MKKSPNKIMKINLQKRPKSPIIIEGTPGYGLVGTIVTDFLIKHLNAKPIGEIYSEKLMPLAAIHENRIVSPIGLFYDEKNNIVIIHTLAGVRGVEWKLAENVAKLGRMLGAKEIICIEGIGTQKESNDAFYFTNNKKAQGNLDKLGIKPLKEGIILGVTGTMLLKDVPNLSCIFVESHVEMADSKAAAKIIELLDKHLDLDVDYKPLLKTAEKFESQLKGLMKKTTDKPQMVEQADDATDYLG